MTLDPDTPVLVIIPTYQEAREHRLDHRPGAGRRARSPRADRRRQQPRRNRRHRRQAGGRRRPREGAAPPGQGRSWRRLPGRVPVRAGRRLRRARRDGRRRLAPAGAAAGAARRAADRPMSRSDHAGSAAARCTTGRSRGRSQPGRQYLRAAGARHPDARRHRRLPGLPGARCSTRSTSSTVRSQGYCFQVDLAWRSWLRGFQVVEVPITFVERERGASKMSRGIVVEALLPADAVGSGDRVLRQQHAERCPAS